MPLSMHVKGTPSTTRIDAFDQPALDRKRRHAGENVAAVLRVDTSPLSTHTWQNR
jgi:hypothetical protein